MTDLLEVTAPTHEAALSLVSRLERCRCRVVEQGREGWTVQATPWRDGARDVSDALTVVESWLAAEGLGSTMVRLDGADYTVGAAPAEELA
jgi:hypothetical protein